MITHRTYGKPCLQPGASAFHWTLLSKVWRDSFGYRPSKRRLRRKLALARIAQANLNRAFEQLSL